MPAVAAIQRKEFGLADPENIKGFSDQTPLFERTLKNQGVAQLLEQAKTALYEILSRTDPKMPLPKVVYGEIEDPLTRGHFVPSTWTITINSKAYLPAGTFAKDLPQLMNTLYHEARHCEQYWHAAKRQATSMPGNIHGIAGELNIHEDIAVQANANKYPSKKQADRDIKDRFEVIDKWVRQFQSIGQRARLSSIMTGVDLEKVQVENKLNEAKKYMDEHGKQDEKYAFYLAQYTENYEKYRSWVHEEDAWKVGEALGDAVTANARISPLKEEDSERYSTVVSLLEQCAESVKQKQMVGAAALYKEAMTKLNEK